jgi:hypothetical protein
MRDALDLPLTLPAELGPAAAVLSELRAAKLHPPVARSGTARNGPCRSRDGQLRRDLPVFPDTARAA